MSPPQSSLFNVQSIPSAGRGVVAAVPIERDTVVYRSEHPAAHVIFWQYRKEVCAQCFHYDRGRKLAVRLNSVGRVFCSEECQATWLGQQGSTGLGAWQQLHFFVQLKSKSITNNHSLPSLTPRPDEEEIQVSWGEAEETAKVLRKKRTSSSKDGNAIDKYVSNTAWSQIVDPDILSYLLSGILFYHSNPLIYQSDVPELAMDTTPYRSTQDLQAHSNSFIQLTTILPLSLIDNIAPVVCQTLINAASHNSFGIRSGSEDGDEYLGYGLYPGASFFNHSCKPNIAKKRVGSLWEFRALREIAEGEECCITYLGGDEEEMTVVERRSRLKAFWGFQCMCRRCQDESA